jgi:threonine dehydrogenase-like Zn-dependent dehydrogenase
MIEVGGPGTLTQSITAARIGGHISLIGVLTGVAGEVPTAALMAKQARLQGLIVGNRRHQMDLVRAIDATGLQPWSIAALRLPRSPMPSGTKSREPISAKSA